MIRSPYLDRYLLAGAGLALIGLGFFLAPVATFAIKPSPFVSANSPNGEMPDAESLGNAAALGALFDLADLPPEPAPVTPPPDPAEALRVYRFLGAAFSEDEKRALFDAGAGVVTLKLGDPLVGFVLVAVEFGEARFLKDGLEVALPLASP